MKTKNDLQHQLSFVFRKSEKTVYLKSSITKMVSSQITYDRLPVDGSNLSFSVTYKKKNSTNTADSYVDTVMIKLNIKVPDMDEYTIEKIRSVIGNYLKNFGPDAQFQVKAAFKESDGTVEDQVITGISEDADIDLTN